VVAVHVGVKLVKSSPMPFNSAAVRTSPATKGNGFAIVVTLS